MVIEHGEMKEYFPENAVGYIIQAKGIRDDRFIWHAKSWKNKAC